MKKIMCVLLTGFSLAANAQYTNTKIQIGQKAPELEFYNLDGRFLKLSQINKGHVVLINFWASWCGPCVKINSSLVDIYDKYKKEKFNGGKDGFTILSVSIDKSKEAWIKGIERSSLSWPYHLSDLRGWESEAGKIYGITNIPQAFLVDSNGKIIGKYISLEDITTELPKDLERYLLKK